MNRLILLAAATAVASSLGSVSALADDKSEITIAAQHAGLAAQASDLAGVDMHLHHTLNCIEGPKGADFSKADLNPCANAGNGAIPDSSNPTTNATLETAVTEARMGLAEKSLKAAQDDATKTAATLNAIK